MKNQSIRAQMPVEDADQLVQFALGMNIACGWSALSKIERCAQFQHFPEVEVTGCLNSSRPSMETRLSTADPEPLLRVREITKSFKIRGSKFQMPVLEKINFDVREGEFISLLGASGCGKTTLLRIIAGLVDYDQGSVTIKGTKVAAPRKDLCMVFQNFGLLPWRSVIDNVAFPLELDGVGRKEREDVAGHYLEIVGLQRYHDHYPHELSGGMQQRVGIARALTRKPLVLLMDEPFGALDAQTREGLQDDFLRIWTQLKTTVIFVTHAIDEALVLSDRIIVLDSHPGRIKCILPSAVAAERMNGDVRALPAFGTQSHEIREHLRHERVA